jgi:hypothetical protein
METYVFKLRGRTFHGFRAGNNRELRKAPGVSVVTRRSLHERTLKPVVGSEEAYDEAFAEDYAAATSILGRLRIERSDDGLLTVTATSASAGEDPGDWVAVERPLQLMREDDSDVASASAGDDDTYDCARCGKHVGHRDYGYMCDYGDCSWGVCTACHRRGARAALHCPQHTR